MGEGVLRGALAGISGPGKSRSGTPCVHFVMHALRRAAEWRVWRHGWSGGGNVGPCTDPADTYNWSRRWRAVRTARKPAAPPRPDGHSAMAAALGHGRKKSGRACACGGRCIAGHLKRLQVPSSFALVSQHPNKARSTRECAVNLERGPRRLTQTPVPLCFSLDTALSLPDTGWILME